MNRWAMHNPEAYERGERFEDRERDRADLSRKRKRESADSPTEIRKVNDQSGEGQETTDPVPRQTEAENHGEVEKKQT